MSIETRFCALLLLLVLPSAAPAFAQQGTPITQASNSIHLDVVVTPKSGTPIPGLKQQDFTVRDNKISQPITSFQAVSDSQAPVEIVLLVDGVNTPYLRLAYAREEIDKFLHANGGHLAHPLSLAIFTDTGTQIQNGSSTDGNALSTVLDQSAIGLRSIRRSSGIYGADERIQLSLQTLRQLTALEAARPGRKIILWLSPGWPLLSGPRIDLGAKQQQRIFTEIVGLSSAMRQAHITLYSVDPMGAGESVLSNSYFYQTFLKGVGKPDDVQLADLSLQVLAAQSGGLVLNGNNDIAGLLAKCVADTSAYYELTFDPAPAEHANEYHHIEVKMADPGLTARTRQGYYAQPR
ncbi:MULTISPECIES: VWA domain-containing protein [Acidobacteriaceae]|uniref:VWA domain-containing protein n=1 Tax=Acidobacteriaceae TaxID=204434 RepID=UPI00131DA393|nr:MULTISPECIES: VWA domain-containing protein [Acidobacteriaceae]MDW5267603.1 VWA domain-containing protein [Edaphobacter sp.]